MRIKVDIPRELRPSQLDARLAQGWLRMGSLMLRSRLLYIGDTMHEVTHIRASLAAPVTRRSARRTLRRNRAKLRCEIGPAKMDDDRRRLYALTRPRFMGPIFHDVEILALGELPDVFNTHEVAVYDGERLVAVSFFDAGADSLYSVMGLHDPEYRHLGLGRYTMLEEMDWGRATGRAHYYPGYVVPRMPDFDYKLRCGEMEHLTAEGLWAPLDTAPRETPALDQANRRWVELRSALARLRIRSLPRMYPLFWLGRVRTADRRLLGGQRHLLCATRLGGRKVLVAEHLADRDRFLVGWAYAREDIDAFEGFSVDPSLVARCEARLLCYIEDQWMTRSADEAAARLAELLR